MVCIDVWRLAMTALCVMAVAANSSVDMPAQQEGGLTGEDAPAALEASAGDQATPDKRDEKRSGRSCLVSGSVFQHGEVFSYPGNSDCIKYRCDNGGYSIVQSACERNSQCVPVGSVIRDGCRSLRCVSEDRGNIYYYRMEPTVQDKCNTGETCVPKNRTFQHSNCNKYQCVPTVNGGYIFRLIAAQCKTGETCVPKNRTFQHSNCNKYQCVTTVNGGYTFRLIAAQCMADDGRCVGVGEQFSKFFDGYEYNCVCSDGGSYSCRR